MKERPSNRLIADDDDGASNGDGASAQQAAPPGTKRHHENGRASPSPARRAREEEGPSRRRSQGQGPYPGRRQVTAHIDRQLFLWLKRISAETDKPMVEIFEEALSDFVNSYAAKLKFGDKG
jgi:hypothetical protein